MVRKSRGGEDTTMWPLVVAEPTAESRHWGHRAWGLQLKGVKGATPQNEQVWLLGDVKDAAAENGLAVDVRWWARSTMDDA